MAKAPKKQRTPKAEREDFASEVARKFVTALSEGTAPWQRPWQAGELTAAYNPTTGNPYKGMNQHWLGLQGYGDPRWLTYKQAEAIGAQVRKGETGTSVEYWKFHDERALKDEGGRPVTDADGRQITQRVELESPRRFYARVFNAEQIDGLPALPPREPGNEWERHQRLEAILAGSESPIRHVNGDRAYYSPMKDHIVLPERSQFPSAENYYATALHELGHSTGHASRLDRDLAHPFGSEGYAKEELVAELYSYMMAQRVGCEFDPGNHHSYVASWIKALEEDPREIFRAASAAEKAMEYVLTRERERELTQDNANALWLPADVSLSQFRAETGALGLSDQDQQSLLLFGRDIANALNVGIPHDLPGAPELTTPFEDMMAFAQRGEAQMMAASHVLNMVMARDPEQAALLRPKWALAAALVEDRMNDIRLDLAEAEMREHAMAQLNDQAASAYAERAAELRDDATIDDEQAQSILDREFPMPEQTEARLAAERVNLHVPFAEKNAAKAAGAKWDKVEKLWYAPAGADLAKLDNWLAPAEQSQAYVKEPHEELADAMVALGLVVDGEPKLDGQWHRVRVDDDPKGERSGAYRAYDDRNQGGLPAGTIQNHRTGETITWKYSQIVQAVSPEVKARQEREKAERNAAREAQALADRSALADLVTQLLDQGQPVPADHAYLSRKDIAPQGLVMMDGVVEWPPNFTPTAAEPKAQQLGGKDHLLIPVHDMDGKVWSAQAISPHGKKSFPRGTPKADMHHLIGDVDNQRPILFAEGYATGRDLHEGTTYPVAVCFDSGNLERVMQLYRDRYPDRLLIAAGDNDHRKEQQIDERTGQPKINVGKTKAISAAEAVGGQTLLPEFRPDDKGSDWNDLRQLHGKEAQLDQLREGMRAAIRRHQADELTRTGEGEKRRQDRDARQLERDQEKERGREDDRDLTRGLERGGREVERGDREQERAPALAMGR